jgi:transposase
MQRYALRDDQWTKIKDFLPGREGHVGATAAGNRLFVDALLYRYRTGAACRRDTGLESRPTSVTTPYKRVWALDAM